MVALRTPDGKHAIPYERTALSFELDMQKTFTISPSMYYDTTPRVRDKDIIIIDLTPKDGHTFESWLAEVRPQLIAVLREHMLRAPLGHDSKLERKGIDNSNAVAGQEANCAYNRKQVQKRRALRPLAPILRWLRLPHGQFPR